MWKWSLVESEADKAVPHCFTCTAVRKGKHSTAARQLLCFPLGRPGSAFCSPPVFLHSLVCVWVERLCVLSSWSVCEGLCRAWFKDLECFNTSSKPLCRTVCGAYCVSTLQVRWNFFFFFFGLHVRSQKLRMNWSGCCFCVLWVEDDKLFSSNCFSPQTDLYGKTAH